MILYFHVCKILCAENMYCEMKTLAFKIVNLSNDVMSGHDITPCIKID